MKQHHKSHHIFAFLGALLLIFVVFFVLKYFQSEYSFENVLVNNNKQSYEEGVDTTNPFLPHPDTNRENHSDWVTFGGGKLSFSYPAQYALRIMNSNNVSVIPPLSHEEGVDCSQYNDEQERILCMNPDMSPNISIEVMPTTGENVTGEDVKINGDIWQRTSYQDEYGGTVWYRQVIDQGILEVSYRHADVVGGVPFDALHKQHGNQYQLDAVAQNKLALAIIKSIELK